MEIYLSYSSAGGNERPGEYGEAQAHHVVISPQEDCGGVAGTVGDDTG